MYAGKASKVQYYNNPMWPGNCPATANMPFFIYFIINISRNSIVYKSNFNNSSIWLKFKCSLPKFKEKMPPLYYKYNDFSQVYSRKLI